jgi:ATP-binding cassette subfamily F protein 3
VLRPLKQEIERVETRIGSLEAEKKALEPQLADPVLLSDFQRSRPIMSRYSEVQTELEALYGRWEKLQEDLATKNS